MPGGNIEKKKKTGTRVEWKEDGWGGSYGAVIKEGATLGSGKVN